MEDTVLAVITRAGQFPNLQAFLQTQTDFISDDVRIGLLETYNRLASEVVTDDEMLSVIVFVQTAYLEAALSD